MKRIPHMILAGLVAFATTAPAFADPPHGRGWDRHDNRGWRNDRHERGDYRDGWRDGRRYDDRRDWRDNRRAYVNGYQDGRRWDNYRDYGYRDYRYDRYSYAPVSRYWGPGDYIPRGTRYIVVNDYGRYHLPPPRRGHYYADYGNGDILLVAAATGLVVWALSQNRY